MTESNRFVKVAVKAAVYSIDKPYTYSVPGEMRENALPGCRVVVPFGRGNRKTEGIILAFASEYEGKSKPLHKLLDESPVLDENMLKLAYWLRERAYCTVFEAITAMLPAGLWFKFEEAVSLLPGIDREEALAICPDNAGDILEALFDRGGYVSLEELERRCGGDPRPVIKTLISKGLCESTVKPKRKVNDKTDKIITVAVSAEEAFSYTEKRPKQRAVLEFLISNGPSTIKDIGYYTDAGPAVVRALCNTGLCYTSEREVFRSPVSRHAGAAVPEIVLNQEQQRVFDEFLNKLEENVPACALLHGVTGSGKTAVYIELIRRAIAMEGQALCLVPEIALTPQLMERFMLHFGNRVAILHSSLAAGERLDEFKRIKTGEVDVVVGTRSAVFAPLKKLRLIILDEEHDGAYKSENTPRYHAVDVAKLRCTQNNALLILGSATPSVESTYAAVEKGRVLYGKLTSRYNGMSLPKVIIADMKSELRNGNASPISGILREELSKNINEGRQSILFINRRGAYGKLICPSCGYVPFCPRCSLPLTEHSANSRVMCHLCGYSEKISESCPECQGRYRPLCPGTQQITEELAILFPRTAVLRMDADTTSGKGAHEGILSRFKRQNIPILVGTQMVVKGLDFENVTLVGVLAADSAFYSNDYRAHERAFAQITQVIGRSGRGSKPGRAVIQTFNPNNHVLMAASCQDYSGFYKQEIELRRARGLPPFAYVTKLTLFGLDMDACLKACMRLGEKLRSVKTGLKILGPAPAGILKVNMRYRYQFTLIGADNGENRRFIAWVLTDFSSDKRNRGVNIFADANPYE